MDLDFSAEQKLLRETVARLCREHCADARLRALETEEQGYDLPFWEAACHLGLAGLLIEEKYGGTGQGMIECAIVHEELGRSLAPCPHLDSSVLATRLLALAGRREQGEEWLPALATGHKLLIPAWREAGAGAELQALGMRAQRRGKTLHFSGEKVLTPFANSADGFLLLLQLEGRPQALIVDAGQATLRRQPNHAGQNLFAVRFDQARADASTVLDGADCALQWQQAAAEAQIALAAQAAGGAARILELTLEHVRQRRQFGQAIGAFQAVAHRLAECATEIEGARYLVYQAAWACGRERDALQLARMAKMQACTAFHRAAIAGVQFHGGMGFSLEASPQLYYRRAKHLQLMHWEPRHLEEAIAREVFA